MDIIVKNKSLQTTGILDSYESFIWTDRYYGAGHFEIVSIVSSDILELMQEGFYLNIKDSEHTMIIT